MPPNPILEEQDELNAIKTQTKTESHLNKLLKFEPEILNNTGICEWMRLVCVTVNTDKDHELRCLRARESHVTKRQKKLI